MSLILSKMINNQLDSFERGHLRSRSFNELLNQYKSHIGSPGPHSPNRAASDSNMILAEPPSSSSHCPPSSSPNTSSQIDSLNASPSFMSTADMSNASAATTADASFLSRKRSFLETDTDSSQIDDSPTIKRSRTAPLLAPPLSPTRGRIHNNLVRLHSPRSIRSRSLSPHKKFFEDGSASGTSITLTSSTMEPVTTSQMSEHHQDVSSQLHSTVSQGSLKKAVRLPPLSAVLGDVNPLPTSSASASASVTSEVPAATPVASVALVPMGSIPVNKDTAQTSEYTHSASMDDSSASIRRHITPTVSLDYFDTYKPNDENWRYELLDSINKGSKHFNLNQYNYLNKSNKPSFDSKISSKILKPTLPSLHANIERKINFPFESNYTYLNKTYLTDVAKYPEYLELAQSLVQLSQPQLREQQHLQQQPSQHQPQQAPHGGSGSQESLTSPTLSSHSMPMGPPIGSSAVPSYSHLSTTSPQLTGVNAVAPNSSTSSTTPVSSYSTLLSAPSSLSQYTTQSLPRLPPFIHSATPQHAIAIPIDEPMRDSSSTAIQQPVAPIMVVPATTQAPPPLATHQHLHHNALPSLPTITPRTAAAPPASVSAAASNNSSTRFVPVSPPPSTSAIKKAKEALMRSPPKHHHHPRVCILCGSEQSPCWRPSWSLKEGQLCNSCGLRYKKTLARCLNDECRKIPAKGEWSLMQSKGKTMFEDGIEGYGCLECGWRVEVKK